MKNKKKKRKVRPVFKFTLLLIVIAVGITVYNQQMNQTKDDPIAIHPLHRPSDINEVMNTFAKRAKKDVSYQQIIENSNAYPEDVLMSLAVHPELKGFVLGYLNPPKADKADITYYGKFPHYLQWDNKWGYKQYGDSNLAMAGCGPTALAEVISGLLQRREVTPDMIADYSMRMGFYEMGVGSSWSLMTQGAIDYGLHVESIIMDEANVKAELKKGHPIICSVDPGDFTTGGHFIVLIGVNEDGYLQILDSNSKKRTRTVYHFERIKKQTRSAWVYWL